MKEGKAENRRTKPVVPLATGVLNVTFEVTNDHPGSPLT